ncbi:MAG: hypothetical protein R3C99_08945 [Pirellulaceae bacterium]
MNNYAIFQKNILKDFNAPMNFTASQLAAAPKHAGHSHNYAMFLQNVREDFADC